MYTSEDLRAESRRLCAEADGALEGAAKVRLAEAAFVLAQLAEYLERGTVFADENIAHFRRILRELDDGRLKSLVEAVLIQGR